MYFKNFILKINIEEKVLKASQVGYTSQGYTFFGLIGEGLVLSLRMFNIAPSAKNVWHLS